RRGRLRRAVYGQYHGHGDGNDRSCAHEHGRGPTGGRAQSPGGVSLRPDRRPRDIATRKAFENAIASVAATGGSTNAVLHLLAMAHDASVELSIDDFQTISARTPLLLDLKPAGRFVAADVDKAGGWAVVAKRLSEGGFIHKEAITVTGRTFADEAGDAKET